MKRFPSSIFVLAVVLCGIGASIARSQAVSGKDVLAPTAYVSYDPIARGMDLQVAVVLKIRPGFHVNAREVSFGLSDPYGPARGSARRFQTGNVIYPKGTLQTVRLLKRQTVECVHRHGDPAAAADRLTNAPLGTQHLAMKLRYQACSRKSAFRR